MRTINGRLTALVTTAATLVLSPVLLAGPAAAKPAVDAVPQAGATAGTNFIKVWAPENENKSHTASLSTALAAATSHDMITASMTTYRGMVPAMHAANPNVKVLLYTNGTYAQENQGSSYPDSWYAKDANGQKIRSAAFGNFLMNPSSAGWETDRVAFCNGGLAKTGYDGCMVDMLGTSPITDGYNSTVPVNPATGQLWTQTNWLNATSRLAADIRTRTGRMTLGNGLGSGTRFFATEGPTRILLGGLDAALAESWIRTSMQSMTVYPSETRWVQAVNLLVSAGQDGKSVEVAVKMWAPGTQAEKDAWHEFALASFMLGSNGSALFNASYDKDQDMTTVHPSWTVDYGTPVAPFAKANGVYSRPFTKGLVLVNPTTVTQVVTLSHNYTTPEGQTVSQVTMAPHTGTFLAG